MLPVATLPATDNGLESDMACAAGSVRIPGIDHGPFEAARRFQGPSLLSSSRYAPPAVPCPRTRKVRVNRPVEGECDIL